MNKSDWCEQLQKKLYSHTLVALYECIKIDLKRTWQLKKKRKSAATSLCATDHIPRCEAANTDEPPTAMGGSWWVDVCSTVRELD